MNATIDRDLTQRIVASALILGERIGREAAMKKPIAGQSNHQAQTGPADTLRPIGSKWQVTFPGNPLDERSLGYIATYEVVGLINLGDGNCREDVRRVGYEKIRK